MFLVFCDELLEFMDEFFMNGVWVIFKLIVLEKEILEVVIIWGVRFVFV